MSVVVRTVREALESANARLVLLQSDARLDAAERALCGELEQANILALNALNAQNIIPQPGQRVARATVIEDKVRALNNVEAAHGQEVGVDAFYNAMDLSTDAAGAIRVGVPTFPSDLG